MIHHGCRHTVNDIEDGPLSNYEKKPTAVGTDYTGRYRCLECKRKVRLSDGSIRGPIGDGGVTVEPPYPDGWC